MGFNLTTFVFEIVNFLVLLFLLQRLVYRPLRRGIAERRAALREKEETAERLAGEAASQKAELEARARSIDELRAQALRDASVAAADERARILEQAREDAAADRARAQHLIDAEREASEAAIRELAITHATSLASRLLTQLAPDALDRALFEALTAELERRGPEWRGDPDFSTDEEVEITWARLPGEETVEQLKATLGRALTPGLSLIHREDGALGAGAVVRFGHRVLDASTAGQLSAFRGRARALIEEEQLHG
jgi:F-type H+-transporting ATPase subunit b